MLDKRSKCALQYFVEECTEGSYKILESEDIISHLPKKFKADEQILAQIVKYLENGDYISVKYADEHKYCLCPLPFGRQFIEKIEQEEKNKLKFQHMATRNAVLFFFSALLGSFMGTLIYYLVM